VSIQDLRPNSQDTSAFYLQNIYLLLADPNRSNLSIPPALANPPPFSPPRYAVWVNSLWFLSLIISLTCALLATLLQQWARRYIRVTQPRYSSHGRGRIRAFFSEGVDKLHLPWAVETLPFLIHLSLFLFFAGLLVFLLNVNHTVFSVAVWWVGLCTATYISITFMPLFRRDSPYYAPLSSLTWFLITGLLTLLCQFLSWLSRFAYFGRIKKEHFDEWKGHYLKWFHDGLEKTAETVALKLTYEIDGRALLWILNCSDEDKELELFFASIPDFSRSNVVNNVVSTFFIPLTEKMTEALIGFIHRTLTSNLVTQKVKKRRLDVCWKAMDVVPFRISPQIFQRFLYADWDGLVSAVEFGLLLGSADRNDPVTTYHSRVMISIMLPRVQVDKRDQKWFELATSHLDISKSELEAYRKDDLFLASCIHFLRTIISDFFWIPSRGDGATLRKTLELVSSFKIEDTLPDLQHEFCRQWNDTVDIARIVENSHDRSASVEILSKLRHAYLALHRGTNSAPTAFSASTTDDHILTSSSSYPRCRVPGHQHPASRVRNVVGHILRPSQPPAVSFHHAPQAVQTNVGVDQLLPTMAPTSGSSDQAHLIPATTSTDPLRGSLARKALHSDSEALLTTSPLTQTSLPSVAVIFQHDADLHPSYAPDDPPVVVPARLQSFQDRPASQSNDHVDSAPGSLPSASDALFPRITDNFQTNEDNEAAPAAAQGGLGDTDLSDHTQWHPLPVPDIAADPSSSSSDSI
jgi:hypothetical protein